MPGPRGRDQVLGVGPERGRVEALGLKRRDGGVGGRRGDGRAGELALFLLDERPDVVGVVGDVDAGGSDGSGRRGGGFERLGGSPVATRCGLGLGLLLGLGLGPGRGRRDARALAVVLLTLAVVRGESDLEPRDLVVRRAELRLREAGGNSGGLFERGGEGGELRVERWDSYQDAPGLADGVVVLLPEDRVDDRGLLLGVDGHVRAAP